MNPLRNVEVLFLFHPAKRSVKKKPNKCGAGAVTQGLNHKVTQRAVQKIVDLAIVEKSGEEYLFSDPFFKKYIQLRFKA